ncbi:hypothetical protein NP511_22180 (plasmid) [Natrinema thermotolerans]|uniref:Uncharacterized protein n=1 Tax=Natrinema thermotolerans TaxID=121872 RepID=A0AAF0T139_9EURY|nr:hypothetical protein [Natrinema thermotolerans]WMT10306.1 hypothetical protein NP511_22180 [Natrinema thermotolerans]
MSQNKSDGGKFIASIHRSILGALLAIAGIVGLAWVREALTGGYLLFGIVGIVVAGIAVYWIYYLFMEGLQER